ncbi:ribonuclease HII [Striga asiatica]|uniref:Ribonuclease HII n=1 Tax=Striga asiatica TaxID=4170 RepID=A0A5A7RKL4_STRAF|nr:ribonuclease HII [Striga asiatica]
MPRNRSRLRDGSDFIPTPSPWICSVYFCFPFIFFPELNVMRRGSHERAIEGLGKLQVWHLKKQKEILISSSLKLKLAKKKTKSLSDVKTPEAVKKKKIMTAFLRIFFV